MVREKRQMDSWKRFERVSISSVRRVGEIRPGGKGGSHESLADLLDQSSEGGAIEGRDGQGVMNLAPVVEFLGIDQVHLVEDEKPGNLVELELRQDPLDGRDLVVDLGTGRVDQVKEEV